LEVYAEKQSVFLVKVGKRDKETSIPIIEQYVEKGSTIITDCWAAYKSLGKLRYTHE
jgi:IS1 family transposase